ncbi:MAG: beta-ketoacyl-ACP synthase II [Candidatus Neomarinimicrobiota bacterium]
MQQNRVVITGLGVVSPIGIGTTEFWQGLKSGRNGIGFVTTFDAGDFRSQLAAEIHDFNPEKWIEPKTAARMDRFTQFAVSAAAMALEDAGLIDYDYDGNRFGIHVGSGIGGSKTIEEGYDILGTKGPKGLNPFFVSKLLINMAAAMISIRYGLKGPISAPSVACSTGGNAIGDALRVLQHGDADIMLAGSAEACIDKLAYGGFCATRSMSASTDPACASRPFDKDRDGFVMGEGSGLVVLETLDHARKRGAKIYGELAGYGNTADAYHFTAPHPESDGMIRVMQNAIKDAGLQPEDIDYINAHGTSTVLNDQRESAAVARVFGDHARKLKISSTKSMIGHLMAGSGSVEFVALCLCLQLQTAHPTINYRTPDPDCPFDYVPNTAQEIKIGAALSNSFGFGGGNVSLLVKKYG